MNQSLDSSQMSISQSSMLYFLLLLTILESPDPDWVECGLPLMVKNLYKLKGIGKMYPWQLEVLRNPRIHEVNLF